MKTISYTLWLNTTVALLTLLDLLVLSLAYIVALVPFALLSRLAGRDPLKISDWRQRGSVWHSRHDDPLQAELFERQF